MQADLVVRRFLIGRLFLRRAFLSNYRFRSLKCTYIQSLHPIRSCRSIDRLKCKARTMSGIATIKLCGRSRETKHLCSVWSGRPVGLYGSLLLVAGLLLAATGVGLHDIWRVRHCRERVRLNACTLCRKSCSAVTFLGATFLVSALTAACLAFTFFLAAAAGLD